MFNRPKKGLLTRIYLILKEIIYYYIVVNRPFLENSNKNITLNTR